MQEYDATFSDGRAWPVGDCPIPDGTPVKIVRADVEPPVGSAPKPTIMLTLARLAREAAGRDTDLPADLAAQHDHYLHGTPKRP